MSMPQLVLIPCADNDRTVGVFLQGEYVKLSLIPNDASTHEIHRFVSDQLKAKWINWYGAELDFSTTTLILIHGNGCSSESSFQV